MKAYEMLMVFFLAGVFGLNAVAQEAKLEFRIIVHATNPADSLPREVVAKMFRRQVKRWKNWPGKPRVEPVDQKFGSPTRMAFTREVHQWSLRYLRTFWQRKVHSGQGAPPPNRDSDQGVIEFVSRMPGGIGYIRAGTALPDTVKELKLED